MPYDAPHQTPDPDPITNRAPDQGPALELLVHGVGGATPEEMLGDPRTLRITGDGTAAVFRRTADARAEEDPHRHTGRPIPEAYCWSRLTSGNGARALWLLLLPFMVVNLAHWSRPAAPPGAGRQVRAYGVLVRLVALSLTVLLVAAACEVALDLLAWQCAGTARCTKDRSWLGFLAPEHHGWWSQPGRRLALCAPIPAALTGLLWYLSNRTWSAYESQQPLPSEEPHPAEPEDDCTGGVPALGRPGFWYGRRLVARLRAAHTAAGLLTVAAAVAGAAARYDREDGGSPALDAVGRLTEGLLAAAGLTVVWVVCRRGRTETRLDARIDHAVISLMPGSALALLLLSLGYAGWSRPQWTSSGRLPGDLTFGALTLGQGALVVALALIAAGLYRRSRPRTQPKGRGAHFGAPRPLTQRPALRGLGGPAVAMLACALGSVMSGGVAQRVADWLDGGATPGMAHAPLPGPPVLLSWQAATLPPLLLVLALLAVHFGVRGALTGRRLRTVVEAEYPEEPTDHARSRAIARARATAGLTDATPWFIAAVSSVTLLLGAASVLGAWLSGTVPGEAARGSNPLVEGAAQTAQALGSWLIGLGFLLFVTWGRRAYQDPSARRTIGILWDIGTFWPRAAHPFAPPCYAERAVPDLTWRMASWTRRTGGRLVISGHSQGSVLAAAAVWQLPPTARSQVALLTYGSPLHRLYGRWFPAYFGPGPLAALHEEVHCWRNLWRATDPIGGPVLPTDPGSGVDRGPLTDPLVYGRTARHPLPAPILGHGDYQADPSFARERDALLASLRPGGPHLPVPRGPDG